MTLPLYALLTTATLAGAPATWDGFQSEHSLSCLTTDALEPPETLEHAGFTYVFHGTSVQVRRDSKRAHADIRLGVLSGIKELDDTTKAQLTGWLAKFKAADVDAILVGGDNAEDESRLDDVFQFLAATELPTYVIIGNWEGRASFNRALRDAAKGHPNLINGDFARRFDGEGFDVITLPGYNDKQFVRSSGGCIYIPDDAKSIVTLAKQSDDPVVLLMHGPPRMKGKDAIDFVPDSGNVGDENVAAAIAEAKIQLGIHGHILEAGQRATDINGKPVPQNKMVKSLFVNPGPANALPWKLNDGKTSYGAAALVTMQDGKAKWELWAAPKPK